MSDNLLRQTGLFDFACAPSDLVGSAALEISDDVGRWRARDVTYVAGKWRSLSRIIPAFFTDDFRAYPDGPPNPHLRAVIRRPLTPAEQPIPVGVVSNSYRLPQHAEVVERCFEGLSEQKIDPQSLRCEIGLTPLGEWMNFRAYFPEDFSHTPADGNKLALRLECCNSVDGSSRLVILLGWLRYVCSNGFVIGETKAALRDVHDFALDLEGIPKIIAHRMTKVDLEISRLRRWEKTALDFPRFRAWVDGALAKEWGKKAAYRVLHICANGTDVEIIDPFDPGRPSEKRTRPIADVPGATIPARNLYDVSQALSWVATRRANPEERLEWQGRIPVLIASAAAEATARPIP
ncbi:MAG: DUF932 domain-containing protein [Chloroflexota bacterium]|nr:MAG: DUF932 domain-containing protein [Chloroflexota bacterium]